MASIRKKGKGYDLRVCCGYDVDGKRIEKYRRWVPDSSMTAKQAEKEAKRQLVLFENEITPVSYTHLDVYKRQGLLLWQKRKKRFALTE